MRSTRRRSDLLLTGYRPKMHCDDENLKSNLAQNPNTLRLFQCPEPPLPPNPEARISSIWLLRTAGELQQTPRYQQH